jgi:hypothetical protein
VDLSNPNGWIRDPTHPAFLCGLKFRIDQMMHWGYTLIKFDFMNWASNEGVRYNMSLAPTGMAAYNYGLKLVAETVAQRAVIDYGISLPLPVVGGHARHHGCEQMYGGIEYDMNEFAGGWWLNRLYSWLDPDLITFKGEFWFRPNNYTAAISMDAKSRVAKAVVYGGVYKWGDDPLNATWVELAKKYLGNARVNAMWSVARAGDPRTQFRPVSGWGEGGLPPLLRYAPKLFARANGDVAIFNYVNESRLFTVGLRDAVGFDGKAKISCEDAWEGGQPGILEGTATLKVEVGALSSMLLECRQGQTADAARTGAGARVKLKTTDDDFHFPSEEPDELVSALTIRVGSINVSSQTVLISHAGEQEKSPVSLTVGETALSWTLRSVLAPTGQSPTAVLERNWARWGALIYLQDIDTAPSNWAPCSVAPSNACVFLRKGLGEVSEIKRPRYALAEADAGHWSKATTSTDDYLKQLMINETADHEASFASAASVLPPTKDYAEVKNVQSHSGFSVSPQGRVMSANFSIRETMQRGDAPLSPGGLLLFDPKDHLPFSWPDTNWTEMKSATLGRFSRAVTVGIFEPSSGQGFSLLATPNPRRGIETQPYDRAELLLRLEAHKSGGSALPQYFAVEACALCGSGPMENCSGVSPAAQCGEHPKLVSSIDHAQFYSMLLEHNVEWQQFHRGADALNLQIHGLTEGTRVVDTARSVISAGMANFIRNRPNYGDGSVYWSVTTDDHGALPLQSFALNNALLLWGHHKEAAERLEYYFNVFVRNTSGITPQNEPGMQRELWDRTPGKIDFKNWGPDARSGWPKAYQHYFQDSIADYGRFLELWSETARAMEEEDPSWVQRTFVTVRTMSQHLFALHDNATHTRAPHPVAGLIVGPAEHDTCKDRGPFFSINFWTWRGWVEVSRFLADTAAVRDAAFATQLSTHTTQLQADLEVAVRASLVKRDGKAFFLPPFAAVGFQPYKLMIAKTRGHEPGNGCPDFPPTNCTPTTLKDRLCNCEGYAGGPTYAGFRYYSEMLSSSFLEPEIANAINDFREAHTGTLSGMTRYEDHLDDMPASGYGHSAVSLSRTESFQALFYGHLANYQSRGIYSAPEQESLYGDGVRGKHFTDSFRATLGEVAVDICVPSTMLPAIMARWMVLFTERDRDVIALFRTAPRRFFQPSLASPAMALERGLTRYGRVSANITVTPMPDDENCSESAVLALSLDMHGRGYIGKTGGLTIEMRVRAHGSCRLQRTLSTATVTGDIGAHTVSVESDTETVTLHLAAQPARGTHALEVHAVFTAAADGSSLKADDESISQTAAQAGVDGQGPTAAGRWEQPTVAVGVYLPGTYAADNGLDPAATSVEAVMAAHGFTFTFGGDASRGPWRRSATAYKIHRRSVRFSVQNNIIYTERRLSGPTAGTARQRQRERQARPRRPQGRGAGLRGCRQPRTRPKAGRAAPSSACGDPWRFPCATHFSLHLRAILSKVPTASAPSTPPAERREFSYGSLARSHRRV